MTIKFIKNISVVFLLLQIFGVILCGQSTKKIFGYVYDGKSKAPLVGTNIMIGGTGIGTSTNQFGYFQFDNLFTGVYSISASYIGYKSKTVSEVIVLRDQPTELNIYLMQSENKLNEVLVSGMGDNGFKNIINYTSKDIQKNNYQSVAEVLEQTSGVEIQSTGGVGSSKKISIRGSQTNQVLVLLDGISLNNQFGGSANLSSIPINIVEKIEVYEGGSSSKFGSGAIGGAINIITKKTFKNEYKINFTGGSFGYLNIEPSISGNYKNLSYYLSYNHLNSKGDYKYKHFNTGGNEVEASRLNADISSENIFARINYNFNKIHLSVNTQKLTSDRGIPGKTKALTAYARSKNNSANFGASIKATLDKFVWDLNYNYLKSTTENSNLYPDDALPEYKRYSRYHYEYKTNITVLNSTIYYEPSEWLDITGGYNGKWLNYNDKNYRATLKLPINSAADISHGLFLHQKFRIKLPGVFNDFLISPSIRYDEMRMSSGKLHRFENQWSPSVSAYVSIGKKQQLYLKSSISRSFRVPTFSDLFYQNVRIEGKPDLLPEKSLNKEIGIGWELNFYGKFKGEATFYNYSIEDMIVWKLGSFEVFRPFNNDADITGQEYSLNYQLPNNHLGFLISYTYLQPLDKNNNETTQNKIIPYRPQHSVKVGVSLEHKNFSGKINYRFVGKRFVTVANTVELPYYNVIDLALLQKIDVWKLNTIIKFSINNLANEDYQIVNGYPIPGRELRLGIILTY